MYQPFGAFFGIAAAAVFVLDRTYAGRRENADAPEMPLSALPAHQRL